MKIYVHIYDEDEYMSDCPYVEVDMDYVPTIGDEIWLSEEDYKKLNEQVRDGFIHQDSLTYFWDGMSSNYKDLVRAGNFEEVAMGRIKIEKYFDSERYTKVIKRVRNMDPRLNLPLGLHVFLEATDIDEDDDDDDDD